MRCFLKETKCCLSQMLHLNKMSSCQALRWPAYSLLLTAALQSHCATGAYFRKQFSIAEAWPSLLLRQGHNCCEHRSALLQLCRVLKCWLETAKHSLLMLPSSSGAKPEIFQYCLRECCPVPYAQETPGQKRATFSFKHISVSEVVQAPVCSWCCNQRHWTSYSPA